MIAINFEDEMIFEISRILNSTFKLKRTRDLLTAVKQFEHIAKVF